MVSPFCVTVGFKGNNAVFYGIEPHYSRFSVSRSVCMSESVLRTLMTDMVAQVADFG